MNVLIVRLENARSVNIYVYLQCVTAVIILGRVALVAQRLIVIKLSRERSVGRSVGLSLCPVHCRKTADRIQMPLGIIGRTGPGMRQFVAVGIGPREGAFLGANLGRAIVTSGDFTAYVCDSAATRPSSQITLGRLVLLVLSVFLSSIRVCVHFCPFVFLLCLCVFLVGLCV